MLKTGYLVHNSFLVKTLVGLSLLKESFEIHGNEKELLYFPMFMDQNFVTLS